MAITWLVWTGRWDVFLYGKMIVGPKFFWSLALACGEAAAELYWLLVALSIA